MNKNPSSCPGFTKNIVQGSLNNFLVDLKKRTPVSESLVNLKEYFTRSTKNCTSYQSSKFQECFAEEVKDQYFNGVISHSVYETLRDFKI